MLNEKEEALQKALSCGDNDLGTESFFFLVCLFIHFSLALYVLMRIKSSESSTDFMMRLGKLKSLPLKLQLQVRRNKQYSIIPSGRLF
jgi:hypothetical protein